MATGFPDDVLSKTFPYAGDELAVGEEPRLSAGPPRTRLFFLKSDV